MTLLSFLRQTVMPTRCFVCRTKTDGTALCPACVKNRKEANDSDYYFEEHTVEGIDRLIYLGRYHRSDRDALSVFIRRAKRDRRTVAIRYAAKEAARAISFGYPGILRDLVIVPVPRSEKAVRRFGFDQSLLLAKAISDELDIRCLTCLAHVGNTQQKVLNRQERKKNAEASYRVIPKEIPYLRHRDILLVDDVLTTGATASACAVKLRECGVSSVCCFTLARTNKNRIM